MKSVTQYITAAMHDGKVNPQIIIDRFEDNHKAKNIELSLDEEILYKEAIKAESRNTLVSFLMIFPAGYIAFALSNYLDSRSFREDDLFAMVFPALLLVAIAVFIKQVTVNSYIKKIIESSNEKNQNQQNVVISGGYSPFTGYGFDLDGWSFTVNLKKSGRSDNSIPDNIEIEELLDFISNNISVNIKGSEISDKIFVNGKDIRNNKLFMESKMSKPIVDVSPDLINSFIGKTGEDIRHYRVITIPMWGGQVNISIFIRFTIIGDQLFAESRYFFLPPLKDNLMLLDKAYSKSGFAYYYGLLFTSLFKSIYTWISGPLLLLTWFGFIQKGIFGDPENKIKRKDETYNYGHASSLRESWSTLSFQRYFQMIDKDLSYKVAQHIIINSIVDYLELKGISTEDIKERQTTILNSGVMVTGGTIKADQMAVGTGAALKNKVANAVPRK